MKLKTFVCLVVIVSVFGAIAFGVQGPQTEPFRVPSPYHQVAAAEDVIAINLGGNAQFQQLGVVDCERRVISIYHVDRQSGEVSLQSVRNMTWDLQLDEFNGRRPTPQEVQEMTDQ